VQLNGFKTVTFVSTKRRQKFMFFTKTIPKEMNWFRYIKKVCFLKNMKILGIFFYFLLIWYHQTVTAIEKAKKAKELLRIILKFFFTQEKLSTVLASLFVKFLTSLIMSARILFFREAERAEKSQIVAP